MCGLVQMCVSVCVCVCVRESLAEDVLILMEELGVSYPAHICVRVESMSKALWSEEVETLCVTEFI